MTVRQDQRRNHHDRRGPRSARPVPSGPPSPGHTKRTDRRCRRPRRPAAAAGVRTGAAVAFSERRSRCSTWTLTAGASRSGAGLRRATARPAARPARPPARIPPPELGSAEEIEIRLAAGSVARSAPPELTAELLGGDGRIIQVFLGPVRPGRHAYRAVVGAERGGLDRILSAATVAAGRERGPAGVAGVYRFEAVRSRQGSRWRPIGGFDPGRWHVRSAQGRALPTTAAAGSGALVLALHRDPRRGSRSTPRRSPKSCPRWSPPACWRTSARRSAGSLP